MKCEHFNSTSQVSKNKLSNTLIISLIDFLQVSRNGLELKGNRESASSLELLAFLSPLGLIFLYSH